MTAFWFDDNLQPSVHKLINSWIESLQYLQFNFNSKTHNKNNNENKEATIFLFQPIS